MVRGRRRCAGNQGSGRALAFLERLVVTRDEKAVELLGTTAQELKQHHQQHDANAGDSKGPGRAHMPGRGDEAGVDGVPVPEHLRNWLAFVVGQYFLAMLASKSFPALRKTAGPLALGTKGAPVYEDCGTWLYVVYHQAEDVVWSEYSR